MSLQGKTVLITRAENRGVEFKQMIERAGGTAILFPTIRLAAPETWEPCDRTIASLNDYHGIFFTSGNAVEAFLGRVKAKNGGLESLAGKMIHAVGEKTAALLKTHGLAVDFLPEKFSAADLAASLDRSKIAGKRFLFPRGNLGRDVLLDHIHQLGGQLDQVVVYRTESPEIKDIEPLRNLLRAGTIDVITFTSPSTAKNFFELVPDYPIGDRKPLIAVIGPVTAGSLEKLGHPAAIVANPSTAEGLIDCIATYLKIDNQKTMTNSQ